MSCMMNKGGRLATPMISPSKADRLIAKYVTRTRPQGSRRIICRQAGEVIGNE